MILDDIFMYIVRDILHVSYVLLIYLSKSNIRIPQYSYQENLNIALSFYAILEFLLWFYGFVQVYPNQNLHKINFLALVGFKKDFFSSKYLLSSFTKFLFSFSNFFKLFHFSPGDEETV